MAFADDRKTVVITLATLPEVTGPGDHRLVGLFVSLSLSLCLYRRRVRVLVVFGRCWCKVEPMWGRVASMAPAANGCAARQTLISCRFRGPFAFTFLYVRIRSGPSSQPPGFR